LPKNCGDRGVGRLDRPRVAGLITIGVGGL